jgi:hypothetical protein
VDGRRVPLVSQPLAADGTVTAHVTAQQNTSPWAKAGPMIRATSDPGSAYYGVFVTPGNGIAMQWRTAQGAATSQVTTTRTVPAYLRVARYTTSGTSPQTLFTAYISADGVNYTAIPGSTEALPITGPALGGAALTSHSQGVPETVTLDSLAVTATEYPPPAVTLASLSGPLLRGLAVTSHSSGQPGTATFDTVTTSP